MSASASERDRLPNERDDLVPLEESADDTHGTRMAYQPGSRVPIYLIAVWVVLLGAYVAYVLRYLVPELREWFRVFF